MRSSRLLSILPILAIFAFDCSCVCADDKSKEAKLAELMKIQGIYEMIEQAQEGAQEMLNQNFLETEQDLKDKYPSLFDSSDQKFRTLLDKFFDQMSQRIPPTEEAVKIYGKIYGAALTEAELEKILEYYKTPIGQKDIIAAKKANQEFNKFFMDQVQEHASKTTTSFYNELNAIVGTKPK